MMLDSLRLIQLKVPHSTIKPMDCGRFLRVGALLLTGLGLLGSAPAAPAPMPAEAPLSFVRISEQVSAAPRWAVVSAEYQATVSGADLRLRNRRGKTRQLAIGFAGAAADVGARTFEPQRRSTLWLNGRGRTPLLRGEHFGRLLYEEIYAGVDLVYYGRERQLEYDFIVRPGADPQQIRMGFDATPRLADDGSLEVGGFRLAAPVIYQSGEQDREAVEGRYALLADGAVGFELGSYDPARALVIDPRIGLASYLGGETNDRIHDLFVSPQGDVWVAGETDSFDFPLPPEAFPNPPGGGSDMFASKLRRNFDDPQNPVWEIEATIILGGSGNDRAEAVSVDDAGRVYLVGETRSPDFPISNDALQRSLGGGADAFLTVLRETDFPFFQLNEEGAAPEQLGFVNFEIDYSTLLGGAQDEIVQDGFLAPFAQQEDVPCVAMVGLTDSAGFPSTIFAVQTAKSGGADGFFSVFCREPGRPAPYNLTYSSFLGGSREEIDVRAGVAANGAFCIGLRTSSPGLPAPGFQSTPNGANDFYATCHTPIRRTFGLPFLFNALGGTYFGGVENETLAGLAVESTASAPGLRLWALLESPSGDIPTRPELPAPPAGGSARNPGSRSLLLVGFNAALDELLTQFWIGGSTTEQGADLAQRGNCLAMTGRTRSADFPVSETFDRRQIRGASDTVAAKYCFDSQLNFTREYSGFFGSTAEDIATAIAIGPDDNEFIAGYVDLNPSGSQVFDPSIEFETTSNAPQAEYGGGRTEGFLLELFRPRMVRRAIVGAADFRERPIAPGQILSLFGANIGPEIALGAQLDEAGRLATKLGPTRVLFNGTAAPLVFAAKNQVSAIAPFFLAELSSVRIEVEVDGATSRPITAETAATAPAVFTLSQTGVGQGAVLHQDFSVNGPNNPARAGDAIQIYLSGGGQTSPPGVDGEITPLRQPFPVLRAQTTVRIGGRNAQVLYAGSAPGLLQGVNQINVIVPRDLPADNETPLEITVGGETIQGGVTIAVR